MREDFAVVAAALKRTYPGVYDVHEFLRRNGLRDALVGNKPTARRGAKQIVEPTFRMFAALAAGERPLMRSFRVVAISDGMVYGNSESLLQLQGWSDDWKEKKDLETTIGCPLSELEVATADASDLVNVAGSRPWEARTVPKKRTTENKYSEPVLKKRRDEGKKPATCTACDHQFLSNAKPSSKTPFGITCRRCGAPRAQYD